MKKLSSGNFLLERIDLLNDTELKFIKYYIQRQNDFMEWIKSAL
jgi:hypothetical protein